MDLLYDCGKYMLSSTFFFWVMRGIHGAADQQAIYNQFKDNMQTLISKAREAR